MKHLAPAYSRNEVFLCAFCQVALFYLSLARCAVLQLALCYIPSAIFETEIAVCHRLE